MYVYKWQMPSLLSGFLQKIYFSDFILKIYHKTKNHHPYAFVLKYITICWNYISSKMYCYSDYIIV